MVFAIQPHVRLQEWVAEENGFFAAEGLEYVFEVDGFAMGSASVNPATDGPVRSGALEDMVAQAEPAQSAGIRRRSAG